MDEYPRLPPIRVRPTPDAPLPTVKEISASPPDPLQQYFNLRSFQTPFNIREYIIIFVNCEKLQGFRK